MPVCPGELQHRHGLFTTELASFDLACAKQQDLGQCIIGGIKKVTGVVGKSVKAWVPAPPPQATTSNLTSACFLI